MSIKIIEERGWGGGGSERADENEKRVEDNKREAFSFDTSANIFTLRAGGTSVGLRSAKKAKNLYSVI
jgi:hypothetical protein